MLFGIVTDNLALGMMIGVAVGLCGGSAAGALKGKKKETSDEEKENGEKVPDWKRAAYVGSYTGADLLIEGLLLPAAPSQSSSHS